MLTYIKPFISFAYSRRFWASLCLGLLLPCACAAQPNIFKNTKDTFFLAKKRGWIGKLAQTVAVNNEDEPDNNPHPNICPFLRWQGKLIENIYTASITTTTDKKDSLHWFRNLMIDLGENFQQRTKQAVILKNLFVQKGDIIKASDLSDNEIYLRQLPFIEDAHIIIIQNPIDTNNVFLEVRYKDVVPFGLNVEGTGKNFTFEAKDENLFGWGDKLTYRHYYDINRSPRSGIGIDYTKRNIFGSFVNLSGGYQNIQPTFNTGQRQETNYYLQMALPLVSPTSMLTGSIELSTHYTSNDYPQSPNDSNYLQNLQYKYNYFDAWAAYNLGYNKIIVLGCKGYLGRFLAIRATQKLFYQIPQTYEKIQNYLYYGNKSLLASYYLFSQTFFHSRYIYGFGRSEDVPQGYNIALLGGIDNHIQYVRPYLGMEYQKNGFIGHGNYGNIGLKLGSYLKEGRSEDAAVLLNCEYFSKLYHCIKTGWYMRHFLGMSLTESFNRNLNEPVRLNSQYGIQQASSIDSIGLGSRFGAQAETVFYNPYKWNGFRFAPFLFAKGVVARVGDDPFSKSDLYESMGLGLRTRNENLVLGTIELRMQYNPRTLQGISHWFINITTGLRYRYTNQYIHKPEFTSYN